jgi:hypothetical protein
MVRSFALVYCETAMERASKPERLAAVSNIGKYLTALPTKSGSLYVSVTLMLPLLHLCKKDVTINHTKNAQ